MQIFDTDSNGWQVPPGLLSSSHHARHGLSRRAFVGGTLSANGATLTLPFGVRARVVANTEPALVIEESAVE